MISVSIKDQGDGIEPEHLSRLTERFYRVDKARSRQMGGTGLGLAIVKHILARHNGKMSIKSNVGKGSTFKVSVLSTLRHNSDPIQCEPNGLRAAQSVATDLKTADEAPFLGDIAHQNDPTSGLLTFVTQLSFKAATTQSPMQTTSDERATRAKTKERIS